MDFLRPHRNEGFGICTAALVACFAMVGSNAHSLEPTTAEMTEVPPSAFTLTEDPAPSTDGTRITRSGGEISFKPNTSTPGNSLGFAEASLGSMPGGLERQADFLVVVVEFSFSTPPAGSTVPTFRVRLNEKDDDGFKTFANAGVSRDGYLNFAEEDGNTGKLRAVVDRNLLGELDDEILLSLDFFNLQGPGSNPDPNFEVVVTNVGYYLSHGDGHAPKEITSAYVTENNELMMTVEGNENSTMVNSTVESYAYDDQFLVALSPTGTSDKGAPQNYELVGYVASDWADGTGDEIQIDTNQNILDVAINGPHVIYATDDGSIFTWDFNFALVPTEVDTSSIPGTLEGISAAGDGETLLMAFTESALRKGIFTEPRLTIYEINNHRFREVKENPVADGNGLFVRSRQSRQLNSFNQVLREQE